ncbi:MULTISPECIES: response regulator transcription factor [Streptomyces]|nr:LuxR C-terminal-related transcriptional regulator [Streptomyces sp. AS02]MCL8015958.1 LuxR C-terminal-related transcriptional regulator [Streptomyces sp. AS02]
MRLSPRQTEIVSLVAEGLSGKEIARTLRMSPKTVEAHIQRMFDKYGVRSRAGIVAKWLSDSQARRDR